MNTITYQNVSLKSKLHLKQYVIILENANYLRVVYHLLGEHFCKYLKKNYFLHTVKSMIIYTGTTIDDRAVCVCMRA